MKTPSHFAFTGRFPVFRQRIVSPLYVSSPDEGNPLGVKVKAVWDTGASVSLVSNRIAELLALPKGEMQPMRSAFGSACDCMKSSARLMVVLGAHVVPIDVLVAELPHSDADCDVLLGLDFISLGDFALSHDGQQLMMSFTYPPIDVPVDYSEIVPRLIPGTSTEVVADLDSDGNERFRRNVIVGRFFDGHK